MKCQHCSNKEADKHFAVNWMGMQFEIHLCEECQEKLTRRYLMYFKSRKLGENPFPTDAGSEIRRKRQLNALKGRLAEAINSEQYEAAARLRDEIEMFEKEVLVQ